MTTVPPVMPGAGSGGTVSPAAEPGFMTTEFWITLITSVMGILVSIGVTDQSTATRVVGIAASAVITAFYAVGRSIRKAGTTG